MQTTEANANIATVNVAIAVIQHQDNVFISKRANNVDLAGLWEFPGGKLELGETPTQAMIRECQEEIGILPTQYQPLIELNYQLNQKHIRLYVYQVSQYTGKAFGKENQKTQWVDVNKLKKIHFPAINRIIINAIQLPKQLAITKNFTKDEALYLKQIEDKIVAHKIKLLQFRSPNLNASQRRPLAIKILKICNKNQCEMLLNGDIGGNEAAEGIVNIHLTAKQLTLATKQTLAHFKMVSASCHNENELLMAQKKGCLFALLSPINKTKTHPNAKPLGWAKFAKHVKNINMPVFALGGLTISDISIAQQNGAHGIAAIGTYYEKI